MSTRFPGASCLAPTLQLHLLPTGEVRPCCVSTLPLGNVAERSLLDIWADAARAQLAADLRAGGYPRGCHACAAEAAGEGRDASYGAQFDQWAERFDVTEPPAWPVRMEFELSNACNLQCLQCSGELSSSIRAHREHRAPLPRVYDDRFFADLAAFVPHLRAATFAGGEPFLASENTRVWELIEAANPQLPITVCTNGTIFGARVERLVRTLRVDVIVSIDGATADTYERVRVGSDFATVMANLDRFAALTAEQGTGLAVNFCLMTHNHHELGAMLRLAEARGVHVNVLPVRGPAASSLFRLPRAELREVLAGWDREDAEVRRTVSRNLAVWDRERDRLRAWVERLGDDEAPDTGTILMFPRRRRPEDRAPGGDAAFGALEPAEGTAILVGVDERIRAVDPGFAALLHVGVDDLLGRRIEELPALVDRIVDLPAAADGEVVRYEVRVGGDRLELALAPVRDETGLADLVRVRARSLR
jgi:MoaA/NifB/PqqE/SkfB family radical SAM enzyme